MFGRMNSERKRIIARLIELAYFMRGGITYDQLMNKTYIERDEISRFLDKRLESESGKMFPQY